MIVTAGRINVSCYVEFVDDDSGTAPGEPTTGLLFSDIETGGSASYVRQGAARVDLTLITLASASAAHADGGFILVDDTNMPGLYRVDFPDAAFATGVDQIFISLVAAGGKNTVMRSLLVDLTDVDLRDSVRAGMTALPNADADAAGGLPISDLGGLDLDTKLANTNEVTVARMGALTDWIDGGRLDILLDAIPTTAMRGTDGVDTGTHAALVNLIWNELISEARTASSYGQRIKDAVGLDTLTAARVALLDEITAVRLAELDAANMPAALDLVLADTGELQTDWVNGGRLDLILDIIAADVINMNGAANLVDLIWDEVLTGATHNVVNSAGRRLRQIQEAGGYTNSAIYIDTINGVAGTTNFENGVDSNPVNSIADADTLAASLGISRFVISPASSITFIAAQENQSFLGEDWTLALGGQSVSGSHFHGASISGTGTAAVHVHFDHCEMGTCTIGRAHVDDCDIEGTITLSDAAEYFFMRCDHAGTAIIDFGAAIVNQTIHIHDYSGALIIDNLGQTGTDILHFSSSNGKLTFNASCVGGTANLNGTFDLVNNGSGITLNDDGAILETIGTPVGADISADIAEVQSDTDDIQTRLPAILVGGRMDSDQGAKTGNVPLSAQEKLDVNIEADTALSDYDGPTKAEMDTAHALLATPANVATELGTYDGPTEAEMNTAHALLATPAQVNEQVDNALDTAIPGSPTAGSVNEALLRLARSVAVIQEYTIDNTSFTATTTAAQVDAVDIGSLEATDDHFNGRIIIFTSGALIHQATDITAYDGTNKRFTYTALTEAPANNDTFIII